MTALHLPPKKKRHGHGIDCSCVTRNEQCEESFSQQVYDYARLNGWLAYRTPPFRPTAATAGFPDLVLLGHGRLIFAELKSDKGRLSDAQWEWSRALIKAPCEVYTWRPQDFPAIEDRLRRPPAPKRLAPELRGMDYDQLPQ